MCRRRCYHAKRSRRPPKIQRRLRSGKRRRACKQRWRRDCGSPRNLDLILRLLGDNGRRRIPTRGSCALPGKIEVFAMPMPTELKSLIERYCRIGCLLDEEKVLSGDPAAIAEQRLVLAEMHKVKAAIDAFLDQARLKRH